MHCKYCNVPLTYYISDAHSRRQSCRRSNSGYHKFESINCLTKFFNMLWKRKESRISLLKHREQRRHTI